MYTGLENSLSGTAVFEEDGNSFEEDAKSELQNSLTSIDVAGEAIELTSELSGHHDLGPGSFDITHRLDNIAGNTNYTYQVMEGIDQPFRIMKRSVTH